mgnify:FL=1
MTINPTNPIALLRAWWHHSEAQHVRDERDVYEQARLAAPSFIAASYLRENAHRDAAQQLLHRRKS